MMILILGTMGVYDLLSIWILHLKEQTTCVINFGIFL